MRGNIRNRNRGLTPCGRERHKSQTVSAQILILLTELFSVLPWSFMMSVSLLQAVNMSESVASHKHLPVTLNQGKQN